MVGLRFGVGVRGNWAFERILGSWQRMKDLDMSLRMFWRGIGDNGVYMVA